MASHRAKTAISFFLIALLISSVTAFQSQNGTCPEVEAMKDFDMNRFLGVWHVIQGTLTGTPIECVTFNLTRSEKNSDELTLNQLPHNEPSRLTIHNGKPASMMSIHWSDTNEADFNVLVTDYENFAGFFICKNEANQKFTRAAAILSRTKSLAEQKRKLVEERLNDHHITDKDLTIVITCD